MADVIRFPWRGVGALGTAETAEVREYLHARLVSLLGIMGLINLVNASVVALTLIGRLHWVYIAAWAGPILIFGLLQIRSARRLRGAPKRKIRGRFLRQAETSGALLGLWWGGLLILTAGLDDVTRFTMIIIVVGMCTGVAALLTPNAHLTSRFFGGAILSGMAGVIVAADTLSLALPVTAIVLILAASFGALNGYRHLLIEQNSRTLAETRHTQLIDSMSASPSGYALYDHRGQLVYANEIHLSMGFKTAILGNEPKRELFTAPGGAAWIRSVEKTRDGGWVIVHTDVSELEQLRVEAQEAREDSEAARGVVEKFVAALTADIRLPLRILKFSSQCLGSESRIEYDADAVKTLTDQMAIQADYALSMLEELTALTRTGSDAHSTAAVSVNAIVQQILAERQTDIESQQITLRANIDETTAELLPGDARTLRLTLGGVLIEAVQQAVPGAQLLLDVNCDQNGAEITVSLQAGQAGAPDDVMRALEVSSGARHPMRRWMMESIGGSISGWHKDDHETVNTIRVTRISSPALIESPDRTGDAPEGPGNLPDAANTNDPDRPQPARIKRAG